MHVLVKMKNSYHGYECSVCGLECVKYQNFDGYYMLICNLYKFGYEYNLYTPVEKISCEEVMMREALE